MEKSNPRSVDPDLQEDRSYSNLKIQECLMPFLNPILLFFKGVRV